MSPCIKPLFSSLCREALNENMTAEQLHLMWQEAPPIYFDWPCFMQAPATFPLRATMHSDLRCGNLKCGKPAVWAGEHEWMKKREWHQGLHFYQPSSTFSFFHHEVILIVTALESCGIRIKWLISMSGRAAVHAAMKGAPKRPQQQQKSLTESVN